MQSDNSKTENSLLSHNQALSRGMTIPRGLLQRALSMEQTSQAIIIRDGIYMIPSNLETSSVKLDPALKELVESIRH